MNFAMICATANTAIQSRNTSQLVSVLYLRKFDIGLTILDKYFRK